MVFVWVFFFFKIAIMSFLFRKKQGDNSCEILQSSATVRVLGQVQSHLWDYENLLRLNLGLGAIEK